MGIDSTRVAMLAIFIRLWEIGLSAPGLGPQGRTLTEARSLQPLSPR